MTGHHRSRRLVTAALIPVLALAFAACAQHHPDTTFGAHSDFGHEIDHLTYLLLGLGALVFVFVEGLLLFIIVRFRGHDGNREPRQTHGNPALEVTWTLIPAVILAIIAVPTVRTIFRTQAAAAPHSLQVQVIGHQWWWEFRYPQYGVITANELYLPVGRTASFTLRTDDVLHSFWIPAVAGKRDLISNHTNYLWFTPDSTGVWNGFCAEYCGASHANMRFKVFVVTPTEFDAYIKHQQLGPVFGAPPAATAGKAPTPPVTQVATSTAANTPAAPAAQPTVATPVGLSSSDTYPRDKLPGYSIPRTPTPRGATFSNVTGNALRGAVMFRTAACIACHTVKGVSFGVVGPNLTHVGSRTTIAGGLYPNDLHHLELWIKNAPLMKPGSEMPALGKVSPTGGGYSDQQIADLAAYLSSLK